MELSSRTCTTFCSKIKVLMVDIKDYNLHRKEYIWPRVIWVEMALECTYLHKLGSDFSLHQICICMWNHAISWSRYCSNGFVIVRCWYNIIVSICCKCPSTNLRFVWCSILVYCFTIHNTNKSVLLIKLIWFIFNKFKRKYSSGS